MEENKKYDVIIIGGSYAGLAAAMSLGRAIRNVLIIDSGKPCNRQTPHSHNFLTQDGSTPAAISDLGKQQVLAYPTIEWMNGLVTAVSGTDHNFVVSTHSGAKIKASKLLFTTGIKDLMPDIKGFSQCWGISVIHCPYCHGYEYKDQQTGILINGDMAFEYGRLIHHWTPHLTIFTNGNSTISEAHKELLSALDIPIVESPVKEIVHVNGYLSKLVVHTGEDYFLHALYARLPFEQHSELPKELGCTYTEEGYIDVDEFQKTAVAGIYAAGDNTKIMRALLSAVASGSRAGAFINHELIRE